MEIKRIGSQPSNEGPADWFTGAVRIDPLFQTAAPARASGVSVAFEPGARTAWHTHPPGQTLIVTAGCVVFNATYDASEEKWKALETYEMLQAAKFVENVYYHELARELKRLGYGTQNNPRGDFEIEGVSQKRLIYFQNDTMRLIKRPANFWSMSRTSVAKM
ncbi:MAG: relaxase domain-containing protein [Limisphaerales bacterium]